jgi:hypothetical protein
VSGELLSMGLTLLGGAEHPASTVPQKNKAKPEVQCLSLTKLFWLESSLT